MTTLRAAALLFDMDGTLVDSHVIIERVWARFADRFGLDLSAILATSHGVRMGDTVTKWLPEHADSTEIIADLVEFERITVDGAVAVAGARELLESLPARRLALVTSAGTPLARQRMQSVDLPVPAILVSADDVTHGKPAPECYLAAASALDVAPGDAVVFEDADAGIAAGLAAGMRVVVVGKLESSLTAGLPRIRDYSGIRVSTDDEGVTLDFD